MPYKPPEDMPAERGHLTENQFVLLGHVFLMGEKNGDTVPFVWSPKNFMGRPLTRTEASTVSTRLKTLIQRGFIKRYGRELSITDQGEHALRVHAMKKGIGRDDDLMHSVLALLDVRQVTKEREALETALAVMRLRKMPPEDTDTVLKHVENALIDTCKKELSILLRFVQATEERTR